MSSIREYLDGWEQAAERGELSATIGDEVDLLCMCGAILHLDFSQAGIHECPACGRSYTVKAPEEEPDAEA